MTLTEAVVAKMNAVRVWLALCVAVLIASCSSTADTARATALKPLDPKAFQAVVDAEATKLGVPGAMVLLRTPQGNFTASVGTTELGTRTPPSANTHFRIASNTKTMTAALIVLLAQDGKLKLSDPVSSYVPNVPNGGNITIAQLLMMRSGLYGYTADPALAAALDATPGRAWTPEEALDIAFRHPPLFAPDASYDYSNTNYALLGLVAEEVGGRPLAEQLKTRLFDPVGLTHTSLPAASDTAMPSPYSHGYMYGGSMYALADDPYPAEMQAAARAGTLRPVDYTNQNPSYASAAGGAISTADDLATWIKALVSGKVFNADFHRQWLSSLRAEDPDAPDGQKYGYGISYQRYGPNAAMFYHGGELPGFNSFMGYDPDNDVALVIWTNLTLSLDGKTTANAMLPAILEEVYAGLSLP
jgi:CubicO group peptidase (beta-lactamase class C family)